MIRTPRPRALDVFCNMSTHRLLLETDAPDLPMTGMVESSPEHLPMIGRSLAVDLGISVPALEQLSYSNACVLFDHDFSQ